LGLPIPGGVTTNCSISCWRIRSLINRPIVVTPKGTRLCRPSEAVLDLLEHPVGSFVKEDGEIVARPGAAS
jgi:hypothetical protein